MGGSGRRTAARFPCQRAPRASSRRRSLRSPCTTSSVYRDTGSCVPGHPMMGSDFVSTAERNGVQVVHRTAAILLALRGEHDGLSLAQIAQRVGLARSTVHRLVAALEQERFVVAASSSRGFRLGPALASLAVSATRDLTLLIHPFLVELSQELNE